jgi:phosphotransferase system HPr-like phosphotransfer protein
MPSRGYEAEKFETNRGKKVEEKRIMMIMKMGAKGKKGVVNGETKVETEC